MKAAALAFLVFISGALAALADESGLRIERPLATQPNDSMSFTLPAPTASHWLLVDNKPVFCGVLLCGGSCQHRGDSACTLRTFKDMLRPEAGGCCARETTTTSSCEDDSCCH